MATIIANSPHNHDFPLGPGNWLLTPEGGLVHMKEAVVVIADVHLGYDWARAAKGDFLPAFTLRQTLEKLERLLNRSPISIQRLIVAGDLVESPRPCSRTARDLSSMRSWLDRRGVALEAVRGNHDPWWRWGLEQTIEIDGWTIAHGHESIDAPRRIIGHHHPALKCAGLEAPCFLVGSHLIVLPAFSANAAGLHAAAPQMAKEWGDLECWAGMGQELLNFGLTKELAGKLAFLK